MDRIFEDTVFIPYALEYDGQIIVLYDPLLHQKVDFSDFNKVNFENLDCYRKKVFARTYLLLQVVFGGFFLAYLVWTGLLWAWVR